MDGQQWPAQGYVEHYLELMSSFNQRRVKARRERNFQINRKDLFVLGYHPSYNEGNI